MSRTVENWLRAAGWPLILASCTTGGGDDGADKKVKEVAARAFNCDVLDIQRTDAEVSEAHFDVKGCGQSGKFHCVTNCSLHESNKSIGSCHDKASQWRCGRSG